LPQKKRIEKDPEWKIAAREAMKPIPQTSASFKKAEDSKKWHLAWVNVDPISMTRAKVKGYIPVKRSEVDAPAAVGDETGDQVIAGDLILMKCPMDMWLEREKLKKAFLMSQLQGEYEGLAERADASGVQLSQKVTMTKTTYNPEDGEVTVDEKSIVQVDNK